MDSKDSETMAGTTKVMSAVKEAVGKEKSGRNYKSERRRAKNIGDTTNLQEGAPRSKL